MQPHEARTHVTVIGILFAAFGAIGIAMGLTFFLVFALAGAGAGDSEALAILGMIGAILGGLIVLLSIPSMVGGIALVQRRSWARMLVLVLAGLNLINIPIGTALGIYTIWALTRPEVVQLLAAEARPA